MEGLARRAITRGRYLLSSPLLYSLLLLFVFFKDDCFSKNGESSSFCFFLILFTRKSCSQRWTSLWFRGYGSRAGEQVSSEPMMIISQIGVLVRTFNQEGLVLRLALLLARPGMVSFSHNTTAAGRGVRHS